MPLLLSYGFRPFFLFGPVFAVLAMLNWLLIQFGTGLQPSGMSARDWHIHEMLFGYPSALIAGFLLTAVPNWTGRDPLKGAQLLGLVLLWVAGRLVMILPVDMPFGVIALLDISFLPLLALRVGVDVVSSKNRRNYIVLLPILVLSGVNIWFQLAALNGQDTAGATRFGFGAVLVLIMLIGGRIIPAFTRNWLKTQGPGRMPVMFNRFDLGVMAATLVTIVWWSIDGQGDWVGSLFLLVAVLHLLRLARWAGYRCYNNMLLAILHVSYAFIPIGFISLGAGLILNDPAPNTAALHLLGIGVIGAMTLAVSLRAALGHTGRALVADRATIGIFVLVFLAAILRALAALMPGEYSLITLSGLFWIAGFGLFSLRLGPMLLAPRLTPKP